MYPVVVSDLDGTLLNEKHQISNYTKNIIQTLHHQGIHFIIATGRHKSTISLIMNTLSIPIMAITSNGAQIQDEQGNIIYSSELPIDSINTLIDFGRQYRHTVSINCYQDNNWYVDNSSPIVGCLDDYFSLNYTEVDLTNIDHKGMCKIFYISENKDQLYSLESMIKKYFGSSVQTAFSLPNCLEVMDQGITKKTALETILKKIGLSLQDTIAFGDGMNDLELLESVKTGILMSNSNDMLFKKLPKNKVIGSHKEDAVARYLASVFKLIK